MKIEVRVSIQRFSDRRDAGRRLARALTRYLDQDVIVLALPRGGVPVGFEVARALGAPLYPFMVRKLGLPAFPELAMGAIASGGIRVMNDIVVREARIGPSVVEAVVEREERELARREAAYDGRHQLPDLRGRSVILVDDGVATGASIAVAAAAVRAKRPHRLVVAVPVAPPGTVYALQDVADDVVTVLTPASFQGVGEWYMDFHQTTDGEVRELLSEAWPEPPAVPAGARGAVDEEC